MILSKVRLHIYDANYVDIYNSLALLTIDIKLNQVIYRLLNYLIKIKSFIEKYFAKATT